jgi:hypothetical protein
MTSPYYPQSNGKLERFHQTLKDQAIRPLTPLDVEEAKRITGDSIDYYNTTRLHSAIGFIAPRTGSKGAINRSTPIATKSPKKPAAVVNSPVKLTLNPNPITNT